MPVDEQAIADVAAKVRRELEKTAFLILVCPGVTITVAAKKRNCSNSVVYVSNLFQNDNFPQSTICILKI
jgi:hypothetical protein